MREVDLPDFNDMTELIRKISELSLDQSKIKLRILEREAEITKLTTTDSKYFVNEKVPSMAYINSTYLQTGLNGELISLKKELAEVEIKLSEAKAMLDLSKTMIDVWRTQEANKRSSVL